MLPAVLLAFAATAAAAGVDAEAALREGNRLFRDGELDAAIAAYRRGPAETTPLLAYNLGTAYHRQGRLPEAVLWYRRAAATGSHDPWLRENLESARDELGAVRLGPGTAAAPLLRRPWLATAGAAVLAWGALAAALFLPARRRRAGALALLAAALALWAAGFGAQRLGPREAVLLEPCGELPAGSEVWVEAADGKGFHVRGEDRTCPAPAVGLVAPEVAPERTVRGG